VGLLARSAYEVLSDNNVKLGAVLMNEGHRPSFHDFSAEAVRLLGVGADVANVEDDRLAFAQFY
jgi:hypothetical protein